LSPSLLRQRRQFYYFESDGTSILVDADWAAQTRKRWSRSARPSRACRHLITHEHYDHIRGRAPSTQVRDPDLPDAGTLDHSSIDREVIKTVVFPNDSTFTIGELNVHARRTLHDAAIRLFRDRGPRRHPRRRASDSGTPSPVIRHLSDATPFLRGQPRSGHAAMGSYPGRSSADHVRFGHLSNDDSMTAVQRMIGADLKNLCLIHLSERNNTNRSSAIWPAACVPLGVTTQLELSIAKQFEATGVYEISRAARPPRSRR